MMYRIRIKMPCMLYYMLSENNGLATLANTYKASGCPVMPTYPTGFRLRSNQLQRLI